METATAESFSTKQNGSSYCSINNLQSNFNAEEDFGPETNIDNIDDGLLSQPVSAKKPFTNFETLNNGFGEGTQSNSEIVAESTEIDAVDSKNVLSDESDEDEWNYIKGEGNGTDSKTNNHQSSQSAESNLDALQEVDHKLNPDAAEFVPVSPTSVKSGNMDSDSSIVFSEFAPDIRQRLLNDEFVASSPLKGQEKSMENVDVPTLNDFDKEIRKRPSNIMPSDPNDSEASFWNDGDVCSIKKENVTNNDTCMSTNAVFGDESCVSKNMDDVNHALEEQAKESQSSVDQPTELQNKFVGNGGGGGGGGVFDNEDYPSIIEKEISAANASFEFEDSAKDTNKSELEKFIAPDEQRLSFHDISAGSDATENIIKSFTDFTSEDMMPTHSTVMVDGQPVFRANSKTPSPVDDLLKETRNNPFALPDENKSTEKDEMLVSETKDAVESTAVKRDEVDFLNGFDVQTEATSNNVFFDLDKKNRNSPFNFNDEFVMKPAHFEDLANEPTRTKEIKNQFELNLEPEPEPTPEPTPTLAPTPAPAPATAPSSSVSESSQNVEQTLSLQILDTDDIEEAERNSQDAHITSTSHGANSEEPPCSQYDAETPYIHDCTRMGEKPDSVHHEPIKMKRYPDLLPNLETSSTMESDKLEFELRESEIKGELHDNLDEFGGLSENLASGFAAASFTNNLCKLDDAYSGVQLQQKEPESKGIEEDVVNLLKPTAPVVEAEITEKVETPTTPSASINKSELTEPLVPAVDTVIADVKKEVKKSIIKKPTEEKAKAPTKPAPKTSTTLAKTKPLPSSRTVADVKKTTSTTSPKIAPTRPNITAARNGALKPTTTTTTTTTSSTITSRTSATNKSAANAKPTVSSTTSKTSVPKVSSPTKSRLTTTAKTNGDVSSAKPMTTRKIMTTLSASKKSPTEVSPTAKPSVNLATRTSLAPRSKPATTTTMTTSPEKPRLSTLTAKRPASAPTKGISKDSKDVTNKSMSTMKRSPQKTSTTTTKTESKLSSGSRNSVASKTSVKRPSTSSTTTATTATVIQSTVNSEHQN